VAVKKKAMGRICNMRKLLLIILAAAVLIASVAIALIFIIGNNQEDTQYETAPNEPEEWAVTAIERARDVGIIGDVLPQGVHYRHSVPRWYVAELVTSFLEVYTGLSMVEIETIFVTADGEFSDDMSFPDVPYVHPHYETIMALARLGILTGGEQDYIFGFHPDVRVSRVQAAVVITRTMALLGHETSGYPAADIFVEWGRSPNYMYDCIADWAEEPVSFVYAHDLMGNITPENDIPRYGYRFGTQRHFYAQEWIAVLVKMLDM